MVRLSPPDKVPPPDESDGDRYQAMPEQPDEFSSEEEEDPMAWESEGWEDVE